MQSRYASWYATSLRPAGAIPLSPASRAPGTSDPVIRMSLAAPPVPAPAVPGGVEPAVVPLVDEAGAGPLCEPLSGVPGPVTIGPVRGLAEALGLPALAAASLLHASKSAEVGVDLL